MDNTNQKNYRKRKTGYYFINDIRIVYKIADNGLLHYLVSVYPNKHSEGMGNKIWLFEKKREIKEAIDKFIINEKRMGLYDNE